MSPARAVLRSLASLALPALLACAPRASGVVPPPAETSAATPAPAPAATPTPAPAPAPAPEASTPSSGSALPGAQASAAAAQPVAAADLSGAAPGAAALATSAGMDGGTPDAGERSAGASCATTADCALTWVPEGGCCPMLCAGRAVTRAEAAALVAQASTCTRGRQCPHPACAPSRQQRRAVCEAGTCTVHSTPASREQ